MKDVVAYLQVIDNPYDAVSLLRIANRPRRGIGDASLARLQAYADAQGISLWEALGYAEEAGVAAAPLRAVQQLPRCSSRCMAGAHELEVPELIERVLERSGYLEALEAERTIEAQGRIENLQELVGVAHEYQRDRGRAVALGLPAGDLALLRPGRDPRRAEPRHADDAAQREGARVPRRLPDRDGGGDLPARALDRGAGARGGAAACYVGMTRAQERLVLTHASARSLWGSRAYNLPSRFLDELPEAGRRARAAAAGVVVGLRRADRSRAARGRALALDRRLRAPRDARRGRRDRDRARRRRHGPLRARRQRAAADARLRAAASEIA